MLRAARAMLAMRHPLDAELVVSELLGAWWGRRVPGIDVGRLLGEGLVRYATADASPAALALLAGVAALGPSRRQRVLAKSGLLRLMRRDVAHPGWATKLGEVRPVECYVSGTRFGDTDDVICTFRYATDPGPDDAAGHALIAVVDHNAGGMVRDAWVTSKVTRLLEHCRRKAADDPMATLTEVSPGRARALLSAALERTERALPTGDGTSRAEPADRADAPAGSLAAYDALLRARVRALPPPGRSESAAPAWSRDRRAVLAARFLASDAAAELSDSYAASRCVDHIIDYGCDIDAGRPLRVSPRKVETFLLSWLPRRVVLLPAEQEAMPHVLAAWIRWAGPRDALPEEAVRATLDAVWESTTSFGTAYRDPATSFGLRREVVRRLLPDGDLSALPRRMFAFPLLTSDLLADDGGRFDPTTPEGRRALLRLDHFEDYDIPDDHRGKHSAADDRPSAASAIDAPEAAEALAAHERLAERLWKGDPANLWEAAQRLLDRGHTRTAVLETLLDILDEAEDETDLVNRLDDV
ncbi:hypothetical protein [Marinactinospora rubrisoli]|uniref:PE-PGRS family protein n=1 Tax=Marinactinospora rubrisoli TaxID=2715399 RepID=A0ABW2KJN7_9ACTN